MSLSPTQFISPTISQTRRHFCQGYKGVVFACDNLQREYTHLNILYNVAEHCKLQRKVHTRLHSSQLQFVVIQSKLKTSSVFVVVLCVPFVGSLSSPSAPNIGFVSPFNIKGLTKSAAPHKKKKNITIFNYHAHLRVDAAQNDQYLCFALSKQSQNEIAHMRLGRKLKEITDEVFYAINRNYKE